LKYEVTFTNSAQKDLDKLPKTVLKKIAPVIDSLALNPRPAGCKKLQGSYENLWRARAGDYRIIYMIEDEIRIIEVRRVRHRKNVYK
jgi:mRNA interferase RelE/StbE